MRYSKLIIGGICLLLAAVFSFVLLPNFYEDATATVSVVTLRQTVEKGTTLTAELLTTKEVGTFGLPDTVVMEMEDALGMVAKETIYSGETILSQRLTEEDLTAYQLEDGQYLLTVALPSGSAGLAGVLRSGDLVDVFRIYEDEQENQMVELLLEDISVQQVLNQDLESLDTLDETALLQDSWNVDFAPAYMVVVADLFIAKTLIANEDCIHLALAQKGD